MSDQQTSQVLWGFVAGFGAIAFIAVYYRWHIWRARSALQRWTSKKHFELLRFQRCFFSGPFSGWTTSANQTVFFVTLRDDSGCERSGWMRFGDFWGGRFPDEPDIIWR
jgi:hypothetical protein